MVEEEKAEEQGGEEENSRKTVTWSAVPFAPHVLIDRISS